MTHPARRLRFALLAAAALLLGLPPTNAHAQLDRLDDGDFINALREQGMSDLLLHYAETADDLAPQTRSLIRVAQLRLQSDELLARARQARTGEDPAQLVADAQTRFLEAVNALIQLADAQPDAPSRVVWLTDAAEMVLYQYLPNLQGLALAFDEFGVTTPQQADALAQTLPLAYRAAARADTALFNLFNRIGSDPELQQTIEAAGLRFKLENYRDLVLPLFLAQSAYHLARQPDTNPYFADLAAGRPDPAVPDRAGSIANERQRLYDQAFATAESLLDTAPDRFIPRIQTVAGRAVAGLGDPDDAAPFLEPAAQQSESPLDALLASLARANLALNQNQYDDADDTLFDLDQNRLVREFPDVKLLLADARHRVMIARANTRTGAARTAAVADAYTTPYDELFEAIPTEAARQAMAFRVHQRWAINLDPSLDPTTLPGPVRVGIAQVVFGNAQTQQAAGDTDTARQTFTRVTSLLAGIADTNAPEETRGTGLYFLGNARIARFLIDQANDEANGTSTASDRDFYDGSLFLKRVASDFPNSEFAEASVAAAFQNLHSIYAQTTAPPAWRQSFLDTGEILYAEFNDLDIAEQYRLFFGFEAYQKRGQFQKAAEFYAAVNRGNPQYLEAQRFYVLALTLQLDQAQRTLADLQAQDSPSADEVRQAENALEDATTDAADAADEVREGVEQFLAEQTVAPAAAANAQLARAQALITLAQIAQQDGDTEGVLDLTDGLDDVLPNNPAGNDLRRIAAERRILALVAINDLDAVRDEASAMIDRFQGAAAPVITDVLSTLQQTIDRQSAALQKAQAQGVQARVAEIQRDMAGTGQTAVTLGELLVDWGTTNNQPSAVLNGFELALAKAYLVAQQVEAADEITARLIRQQPKALPIILVRAEALYRLGLARNNDPATLRQAATLFDKVITFYRSRPDAETAEPHWRAWAHRFLIMERMGLAKDVDIAVRRLESKFPTLGVEPWTTTIRRVQADSLR
ncbi:MAG: hypothetical protein AAF750_16185 [Planctomycetota bacterium]